MIKTAKDKVTARILARQRSRKLPAEIQQLAYRKLRYLNNARTLQDLRIPLANRLEKLKGDRTGQYSVRINDQWRVCFRWRTGDASELKIVGYHR